MNLSTFNKELDSEQKSESVNEWISLASGDKTTEK